MLKTIEFDVVSAVFIGTNIWGLEDKIDLNARAPEDYILDYVVDPELYWKGHGLDYFCGNWKEEWVGVSLERVKRDFGEYSFNDIRMYIKSKLRESIGLDIDFSGIDWHNVVMVVECE